MKVMSQCISKSVRRVVGLRVVASLLVCLQMWSSGPVFGKVVTSSLPKSSQKLEDSLHMRLAGALLKNLSALRIPSVTSDMSAFERKTLTDITRRKTELCSVMRSILEKKECFLPKVKGIPFSGSVSVVAQRAASVRHLFGSKLNWFRFSAACDSSKATAERMESTQGTLLHCQGEKMPDQRS